jgi:uncharacterized membrane protein
LEGTVNATPTERTLRAPMNDTLLFLLPLAVTMDLAFIAGCWFQRNDLFVPTHAAPPIHEFTPLNAVLGALAQQPTLGDWVATLATVGMAILIAIFLATITFGLMVHVQRDQFRPFWSDLEAHPEQHLFYLDQMLGEVVERLGADRSLRMAQTLAVSACAPAQDVALKIQAALDADQQREDRLTALRLPAPTEPA